MCSRPTFPRIASTRCARRSRRLRHDTEMLAEAGKIKMDMTFHAPEQLEKLVAALYATPPDLIETVKKLVPNLQ